MEQRVRIVKFVLKNGDRQDNTRDLETSGSIPDSTLTCTTLYYFNRYNIKIRYKDVLIATLTINQMRLKQKKP